MLNARQARENAERTLQPKKPSLRKNIERGLNKAIHEEIAKNNFLVTRYITDYCPSQEILDLYKVILEERGYSNISIEDQCETHDRYVDICFKIQFSF